MHFSFTIIIASAASDAADATAAAVWKWRGINSSLVTPLTSSGWKNLKGELPLERWLY